MQNQSLSGAFDTIRKKNLWAKELSRKLRILQKKLERKIKARAPKKFLKSRAKQTKLINLRLMIELRKKLDAIKQKINKNN